MIFSLRRRSLFSIAIALLVTLIVLPGGGKAQQVLGIAAVVNEEVISFFDLQSRTILLIRSSNQQDTPENRRRYVNQVLNQLISERLQIQEADRLGITVSKKEKERAFKGIAGNSKMTSQQLQEFLESIGVDKDILLEQLNAQIAWNRTVNRLFRSEVTIGNDEIDDIIGEITKGKGKPEYLVAEIFLPIDLPENAQKQLTAAGNIISQLRSGANFSVLAKNFSQSATAAVGGDMGWVRQGQLTPELEKTIVSLGDGDISEPVRSVSGYHIVFRRQSRTGQGLVSENEQVELQQVFFQLPASPTEQDVKAGMAAAEKATSGTNGCAAMSEIGKQTGSPLSGALGKVKTSSMPPQTRDLLSDLKIGKPSLPIRSGDGIVVLMVCERTGKVSIARIRDNIESSLLNERLDILARRHLRELRRTAFLDIRL